MRPGTPAFVGSRLKEARESRGLSASSLAAKIGVSRQAVSQYEHGNVTPHPEVMRKITSILNLPYEFFWQPARPAPDKVFFRSLSSSAKVTRMRGNWRLQWLKDICNYLQEFIEFPPVNIPQFDLPNELESISNDLIEDLAHDVRRYWRLGNGVINDLIKILEKNGIVVSRDNIGSESIYTFSDWEDGQRPCMVLGCSCAVRSRIDAGHELGHIILHHKIDKSKLCSPEDFKLAEQQAQYFAGAFLLPKETFTKDCGYLTLESLKVLKEKWKLSVGMMIQRAQQIGLCSDDQAQRLWKSYSRRGWKKKEPLDDELGVEKPHLLSLSFELITEKDIQTRDEILSNLPISRTDIEELAGLPYGFLEESPLMIQLSSDVDEKAKKPV